MARKSKSLHSSGLLNALSFVGMNGAEYCQIGHNWVTSITDNICMGFAIEETLACQANIKALTHSLTRAKDQVTITQLDIDKLHVSSNGLEVYVNCEAEVKHVEPDKRFCAIDSRFTKCLDILHSIVSAHGDHISVKSVLCYGSSCFATNRHILIEFWNGIDLPYCKLSKKFVDLILKSKKEVEYFGYSISSVTVYFKDGSWIMGRQEKGDWINPFEILNVPTEMQPLTANFKTSLKAVLGFAGATTVTWGAGRLQSHAGEREGAISAIADLAEGGTYGTKEMKFLLDNGNEFCIDANKVVRFFGSNIRGAISSRIG